MRFLPQSFFFKKTIVEDECFAMGNKKMNFEYISKLILNLTDYLYKYNIVEESPEESIISSSHRRDGVAGIYRQWLPKNKHRYIIKSR